MNHKKPNKLRSSQRQKLSHKMVVAAGISVLLITIIIITYIQFFKTETSKAENTDNLTMQSLPVDFRVEKIATVSPDTNSRNGLNYKIAKPLSLTPKISQ